MMGRGRVAIRVARSRTRQDGCRRPHWTKVVLPGLIVAAISCGDKELTNLATDGSSDVHMPTASSLQTQTNALSDPDFELASSVWQKATHAGRSVESGQAINGVNSLKMVVSKTYDRDVYQVLTVTPGQSYYAETWIKTSGVHGGGASLRLVWVDGAGSVISTVVIGTAASTQNWAVIAGGVVAPAGAARVRFQLFTDADPDGVGTAWFDDNIFDVVPGSGDGAPPTVALTAPGNGTQVQGVVTVSANASDDVGVAGVQFLVNGTAVSGEDTTQPYATSWDTRTLSPGTYQLTARARDLAGKTQMSAAHTVTVTATSSGGDTVRPVVSITAPAAGSVIAGTSVSVTANASDNVGVAGVSFRLDGQLISPEDVTAPYGANLNTTNWSNGSHVLTAVARDQAGNTQTSAPVSVTIQNQQSQGMNVTYCSPGGVNLKMDVYYPPVGTPTPTPVLMFIHGGGWIAGDKTSDVGMYDIPRFTKRGYLVVSINYRIGHNIFPAYVEDAKCAIRHLRANAASYRLDPQRIGVWGHSAGGHIAALLATTSPGVYEGNGGWAGYSSRVKAIATYEAPFDLTGGAQDFETTVIGDIDRVFGTMKVEASPVNHVTSDDPPFLIVHGDLDQSIYMPQAQKMINRLQGAGVGVQFLKVTNGGHYL